jgi:pseudaminic acid synthase
MKDIIINNRRIGLNYPPYIVAEMSGNHHQSLEEALKFVNAAKEAGVHAIKLQTYTPDTITLNIPDREFFIADEGSLWKGRSLYELYQEAHLPWDWHQPIFNQCKKLGLTCFSTPFDETAVDLLEELEAPCYKIASLEIVDLPLIRKVAATKKPLIISTGASSLSEIDEAVQVAREAGCEDLILLKCTSAYPASPSDANLRTLPHLSECFSTLVGLSDHSLGIGVALASVALGACLIEKHMTLSRSTGGVDDAFSMEPAEFKALVIESERAWQSLGSIKYTPLKTESVTLSHRPSLYFDCDVEKGSIVSARHVRSVRPGKGLPPKELEHLIGLKLTKDVKMGTPVSWDLFK